MLWHGVKMGTSNLSFLGLKTITLIFLVVKRNIKLLNNLSLFCQRWKRWHPGVLFWSSSLSPTADLLLSDDVCDTSSDLMLAQMLQMQFDREFDDQLRREEKKFNGDSKGKNLLGASCAVESKMSRLTLAFLSPVSISFENFRMVHPYEDSESSEDEVDWQDTRHDPYRAGEAATGSGWKHRTSEAHTEAAFMFLLFLLTWHFRHTSCVCVCDFQTSLRRTPAKASRVKARTSQPNTMRWPAAARTRRVWTMYGSFFTHSVKNLK